MTCLRPALVVMRYWLSGSTPTSRVLNLRDPKAGDPNKKHIYTSGYTPVIQHSNGAWTRIQDVFPFQNGDIPLLC